jgi:hypothetical protein
MNPPSSHENPHTSVTDALGKFQANRCPYGNPLNIILKMHHRIQIFTENRIKRDGTEERVQLQNSSPGTTHPVFEIWNWEFSNKKQGKKGKAIPVIGRESP